MFPFGVYGHLVGLNAEEIQACLDLLSGYECEIVDGDVLDFTHEGVFTDIDSILDVLPSMLRPSTRGVIDIINHQDWEMFRCTLSQGELTRAVIHLDHALDTAYASESGR
jgi:hypothetical protein